MRARRSSQSVRPSRLGALLFFALIFAAQGVSEVDHALLHASAAFTVHDEASHPNSGPHLEQEEHPGLDVCVVCLRGSKTFVHLHGSSSTLAGCDSIAPVVTLVAARSDARVSGPPRAPPA